MKLDTRHIDILIYLEVANLNPDRISATRLRLCLDLHAAKLVNQLDNNMIVISDAGKEVLRLLESTLNNAVKGN